jgi:ATP-binding cassette subfamily B multidrug efflux pump
MSTARHPSDAQDSASQRLPATRLMGKHGMMQGAKPKQLSATLSRLWGFLRQERRLLWLGVAFAVLQAVIAISTPLLIGMGIDAIAEDRIPWLQLLLLILVAAYGGEALFSWLQGWLLAGISQQMVSGLRGLLFAKMQKLPLSYFDSRPHGETMSRLTNDMEQMSGTVAQSFLQLMAGAITIVGSLVMMLTLSPLLTLAALITVPLVFLLTRTISSKTRVLFKEQQAQLGALNGHVEETISGQEVVKAFHVEDIVTQQFTTKNARLTEVSIKAQIWSGFLMPILSVINNIGFAAIALVGGLLAVQGAITVGVIASFVGYSRQFVRPLNELAQTYNQLQSGLASAERAFEMLDESEELPNRPTALNLQKPAGHIRFDQVHFAYRPEVPILKNMSFEAPAGSRIALVGPTGAGKTTIVNLLTRFYEVTSGTIWLDGRDLREYSRESLRRAFGMVLQDTYLFSGTIRENIMYGRPDSTDEEVREAAQRANAEWFIQQLPHGYDTRLTENGGNISQGQRQLLAIARVMLMQPAMLILDEATSNIDTRTELQIQQAMSHLMQGRTSFIIAHRLQTIRDADHIIVIDQGAIAEQGTHAALMARQGIYHEMFLNQFKNGG